jgi:hypothetical protein
MFNGQSAISNGHPPRHESCSFFIGDGYLIIGHSALMFTPLESPAVCSGDEDYSIFSEHGV